MTYNLPHAASTGHRCQTPRQSDIRQTSIAHSLPDCIGFSSDLHAWIESISCGYPMDWVTKSEWKKINTVIGLGYGTSSMICKSTFKGTLPKFYRAPEIKGGR